MSKVRWDETQGTWLLFFLCLKLFETNLRKDFDLNRSAASQNSPSFGHIKSCSLKKKKKKTHLKPVLKVYSNQFFTLQIMLHLKSMTQALIPPLPSPATGRTCLSKKLDSALCLRLQWVKLSYGIGWMVVSFLPCGFCFFFP